MTAWKIDDPPVMTRSGTISTARLRSATHKLVGIDASRGIAASLVVAYHVARHLDKVSAAPVLKHLFQFGHAAIDYFFVISGFVILFVYYDDISRPSRVIHYLSRRAIRVLPIYWIALALTLLMNLAGRHARPAFAEIAWSASLFPTNHPPLLDIAWTLQFEVLFYALFALLILHRLAGLSLLALWISIISLGVLKVVDVSWLPAPYWGTYNLEFFAGMAVAMALRHNLVRHGRSVFLLGLVLLIVRCGLEDIGIVSGYDDAARLGYGVPSALIVLGLAQMDRQSGVRVPRWLCALGRASYSIYLFQFAFIGACWQLLVGCKVDQVAPVPLLFIGLTGASIAGAVVVSVVVEHPLLRLLRKHFSSARHGVDGMVQISRL